MKQVYSMRLSTWILALVQMLGRSLASAASWECPQCGSHLSGRVEDGTLSLTWENVSHAPSLSHFKHVAEVTSDGKCSIYCASVASDAVNSRPSGDVAGISSLPTNPSDADDINKTADDQQKIADDNERAAILRRRARESQPCGCDLGAGWYCDEHCDNGDHRAPSQVVRNVLADLHTFIHEK